MSGEYLRSAYPLTWPEKQPRTPGSRRRWSKFKVTLGRARDELVRELELLGAKDVVISSNVPVRRDGLPYSDTREPEDPGVAVYFARVVGTDRRRVPFVVACDAYNKVTSNLRAVGVTIEALRAIQRHGASEMLEQAFTGFAALPSASTSKPWWEVLGVERDATSEEVMGAYRELARIHHPDAGGSHERMVEINAALSVAKGEAS